MTEHPLNPQREYEALADALRLFHDQPEPVTIGVITVLRDAVARATEVWQVCELQRAPREKEFRYHVVQLKLLLAGVYQTLDALPGVHLPEALFQVIAEGKGAMPGSADVLSADDRKAVVAFVRLLTPGYESYDRYGVGCHGQKGQPPSREILDLLGQTETWQQPPSFDQDFFRTRTDEQLRKGIRHMVTRYRAPMPHFAGD